MEVTRFGSCITPPGCTVDLSDSGSGVINFSVQVGTLPDGIFTAAGTATETFTPGPAGSATSILMVLTNLTVQGVAGGIGAPPVIEGEIGLVSTLPIVSPGGVTGGAFLNGQFQNPSGTIGSGTLSLEARVDGGLLGRVTAAAVPGGASPQGFSGTSTGVFPFPVDNLLIGTFDFSLGPSDGFFLPGSGDVFATAVPEPGTLLLLGSGVALLGRVAWRQRRGG
jgi:hypothetical protein